MVMNESERGADRKLFWVALNLILSEYPRPAQKVVGHFADLEEAFRAPRGELRALGLDEEKARRLTSPSLLEEASRTIARLEKKGYFVMTLDDPAYPANLREIFDPPYVLYGGGSPETLADPSVAVVGARRPTPYRRAIAERLAKDLAACGLVVVSGMALGIDSLAHWGALAEGRTIAVLGSGLEDIYPQENRPLFCKIAETGTVVTEFPPEMPPLGFHFPLRNRIISGLSLGTVVVEATRRSGSLITARLALEQNREVMAVPGNLTSDLSQGTNWLIKSGAKLVETWEDVVEEMPSPLRETLLSRKSGKKEKVVEMSAEERKVYDGLKADELVHIDDLVERHNTSVSEILSTLLSLELKGLIRQAPGKLFQRSL